LNHWEIASDGLGEIRLQSNKSIYPVEAAAKKFPMPIFQPFRGNLKVVTKPLVLCYQFNLPFLWHSKNLHEDPTAFYLNPQNHWFSCWIADF
jgi:hypothetical protein